MPSPRLRAVIDHCRGLAGASVCALSDSQLLERFLANQDPLAFEVLVWRHSSTVLGVCRRVLGDAHDAEDAFQAAFLILLRKARSVGKREALGAWLYRVAYRVALEARQRRRSALPLEGIELGSDRDDPEAAAAWREVRPLLDEEISRLPAKYRTPFVLFYLDGKAYRDIARETGWPIGTISTRLTKAKELLRRRLVRRGVSLSAGAWAAVLTGSVSAAVSGRLVSVTVRAAAEFAAGKAVAVGTVPAPAVLLAERTLRSMMKSRLQVVVGIFLAVVLAGGGATSSWPQATQAQPSSDAVAPVVAPPAGGGVAVDPLEERVKRLEERVKRLEKLLATDRSAKGSVAGPGPKAAPRKSPSADTKLIIALRDPDPEVRLPALIQLLEILRDNDANIQLRGHLILTEALGDPNAAVLPLLEVLRGNDAKKRYEAVQEINAALADAAKAKAKQGNAAGVTPPLPPGIGSTTYTRVYAPCEGRVSQIADALQTGRKVRKGQELLLLYDPALEKSLHNLQVEIRVAQAELDALAVVLLKSADAKERLRANTERDQKAALLRLKKEELAYQLNRSNCKADRPGYFWLRSPIDGILLSRDFRENLLGRTVKTSETVLIIQGEGK